MDKKGFFGRLALFASALIWGTSFVMVKNMFTSIGVLWMMSIRFLLATALLMLLSWKKLKHMDKETLKGSVLMGVCLAAAYIFQNYGLVYTTPGKNAFLTTTYCMLVPFMAWGIYRRRPGGVDIAAAVLCVAGIGFVCLDRGFRDVNLGDMLTLCCGVFYALQLIMLEHYGPGNDALAITAVEFAVGTVIFWAGALLFESAPAKIESGIWWNIAYLTVMCTAVCYYLQTWGMKYTPSAQGAVIQTFEAVFGVLFSVLLYGEPLTPRLIIGFALIFFSVVIPEIVPKPSAAKTE
ncbi:MAG: DMT family transporter [Eubacteriales bacterium]|nr:DMT family transporter [Eubacteriales bacterium]